VITGDTNTNHQALNAILAKDNLFINGANQQDNYVHTNAVTFCKLFILITSTEHLIISRTFVGPSVCLVLEII
jgi:hypothetical protein